MKMTKLITGTRIVLIMIITICVSMSACKKDVCTVYVDNETETKKISVETGKQFRICFPAQLSTGFSWIINKKSDNITVMGEPVIQENETEAEVTGRPEKQFFTFKATSNGAEFIEFLYTRQWRKDTSKDRVVRLEIIAE